MWYLYFYNVVVCLTAGSELVFFHEMFHLLEKAFGGHVMMIMMEASNQIVITMFL